MMMIEINDLQKKFKEVHALKGISLTVKKGEIYGFIGKNGAGKSTTMNILAGLSKPLSGSCTVNGRDVTKISHPGELSMGYLPESPSFYGWMTARESLEYLAESDPSKKGKTRQADISEMLSWVGLEQVAGRRIGGFSRGMKQRLGLCQILMHQPDLLILDEPSSALDPEGRSEILRLIRELNHMGKTIIFSSHILSDVERVCHTVGMIADGKMLMEKPLQDMLQTNLSPIYDLELVRPLGDEMVQNLLLQNSIMQVDHQAGDRLSIAVKDMEAGSRSIMAWFADRQIPLRSLSLKKHSLEDIFVQEVNGK